MPVIIRDARASDLCEWLRMRRILWDDCPDDEQIREIRAIVRDHTERAFVAERDPAGEQLCGFLEASLRSRADGCEGTPVGYIEGWYVDEDRRHQGVGRALVEAAETWARSLGCRQMASDAEWWNAASHRAHLAIGYEEAGRVVRFKKELA